MSDEPLTLGANANADLKGRAEELAGVLDDIAELQDRAKEIKADAKAEGYDMKAFNQVVKEKRRGASYQADVLQLELVLDTYRRGVGLPVTLEEAQKRAAEDAGALPEPKKEKKAKGRGDVIPFGKGNKDLN
jgi:uncharacterized protein (UPF0335 family)